MRRSFAILAGFTLALLAVAGDAQAQNYFQTNGGFYIAGRGGLSQARMQTWNAWYGWDPLYDDTVDPPVLVHEGMNTHQEWRRLEMDYGYVVGGAVGYAFVWDGFPAGIRVEAEANYREHEDGQINSSWWATSDNDDSISLGDETVPVYGTMNVATAMVNVMLDVFTGTRFTPYIGLGGGASRLDTEGYTIESNRARLACGLHCDHYDGVPYWPYFSFEETYYALAWQGILGVSYQLTQSLAITVEARHFRVEVDRASGLFDSSELGQVTFDDWSMGFRLTF